MLLGYYAILLSKKHLQILELSLLYILYFILQFIISTMKKLWLWIIAFLLGQGVVLYKKDKVFQKEIKSAEDFSTKCKIFVWKLFGYNKSILQEAKQVFSDKDLKNRNNLFLEKKTELIQTISQLQEMILTGDKETLAHIEDSVYPYIQKFEEFIMEAKVNLQNEYQVLAKKTWIEKHITLLTKLVKPYLQSTAKKVSSR